MAERGEPLMGSDEVVLWVVTACRAPFRQSEVVDTLARWSRGRLGSELRTVPRLGKPPVQIGVRDRDGNHNLRIEHCPAFAVFVWPVPVAQQHLPAVLTPPPCQHDPGSPRRRGTAP